MTPKWVGEGYEGYKTFEKDLKKAQITEVELSELLQRKTSMEILGYNDDYRYDTLFELNGKNVKVEIKEDFTCEKTGNVGLEYSCRGKSSGIMTSQADMYFYKLHTPNGIVNALCKTSDLKKLVATHKFFRKVNGGDPGSNSLNYLFKLDVFMSICKIVKD